MATKQEERTALEQIRLIIESVGGSDSYIGQAFKGCLDMAASNIENDFWNSYKDALDYMKKNLESELESERKKVNDLKSQVKQYEIAEKNYDVIIRTRTDRMNRYQEQVKELTVNNIALGGKVKTLEQENMRLKAKLYDMMVEEGE